MMGQRNFKKKRSGDFSASKENRLGDDSLTKSKVAATIACGVITARNTEVVATTFKVCLYFYNI